MGQCLHEEIEEISTLLAGSTRVSRRVTRQGGLTRLDYRFHVNAYKHLTAKGLPAAVIQPGLKSNPGSCKEALTQQIVEGAACNDQVYLQKSEPGTH